jgi:hypothetical protein
MTLSMPRAIMNSIRATGADASKDGVERDDTLNTHSRIRNNGSSGRHRRSSIMNSGRIQDMNKDTHNNAYSSGRSS